VHAGTLVRDRPLLLGCTDMGLPIDGLLPNDGASRLRDDRVGRGQRASMCLSSRFVDFWLPFQCASGCKTRITSGTVDTCRCVTIYFDEKRAQKVCARRLQWIITRPQTVGMMSAVRESPACHPRPSIEAATAPDLRACDVTGGKFVGSDGISSMLSCSLCARSVICSTVLILGVKPMHRVDIFG